MLAVAAILAVLLGPLGGETKQPQPRQMLCGHIATSTEFPIAVEVRWSSRNCSGAPLTPKWVLTAAHCVDGASFINMTHISSGEDMHGLVNEDVRADRFRWGVLFHPDYNPLAGEASIRDRALIELDEPLTSRYVKPVTLPS